ncbi:MAG: UvrD-helicase domain-containing protein [Christensenellaceae bacterium]|jgi:ATP-dependent helicase/nuclease subunit A|nr:UvrD-helicase domain-containing protein [Christensenellaceae bacterium]
MEWTNEQQKVFREVDSNLLVSASAGCGKTAVMVERIFRYLENGGSIKRLVIITFTRAAASEMKEKLTDVIYSAIRNGSKNTEHLSAQVREIPFALIGTIDGFCAEIYRRHFEDLGGDPNFTVVEEKEAYTLFNEACDEIVTKRLESEDERFFSLLDSLSDKRSNDLFKSVMRDVYNFLAVRPDQCEFIERVKKIATEDPSKSPTANFALTYFRKRAGHLRSDLKQIQDSLTMEISKVFDEQNNCATECDRLLGTIGVTTCVKDITKIALEKPTNIKACVASKLLKLDQEHQDYYGTIRDWGLRVKELLEDIKKMFTYAETEDNYEEFLKRETEASLEHSLIIEIALETSELYAEKKKEKGYLDFNDTERFALKILSDEARAKAFASDIDAVYLDEYQDTNYLQEAIIRQITEYNLFMVGDVKQSIYGFRLAEPEIFLDKKKLFAENPDEGQNLLLNGNFRSVKPILDFANLIFDEIMTYDFGGIDYKYEARLKPNPEAPTPDKNFPAVNIKFFIKDDEIPRSYPSIYSVKDDYPTLDELKYPEGEYIAKEILKAVGIMEIYDRKIKAFRKLKYSDITILVRKKGIEVEQITLTLEKYQIPFNAGGLTGKNTGIKDVQLLISYLNVIDNYMNDVPLYAVMSSYLGGFTQKELAQFRNAQSVSVQSDSNAKFFWYTVKNYMGAFDLMEKRDRFFTQLERFRKIAQVTSVSKLLDIIMAETGFDGYLISKGGKDRIGAVNSFVYSVKLTGRGRDIKDFLAIYDPNGDGQSNFEIPTNAMGEDCVTFYSVHKSKGLEFPFVFLAACNQKTDRTSLAKKDIIFDDKLGMAFKWRNSDTRRKGETLSFRAIKLKKEIAAKEELSRLLYVGITRAESRLLVTGMQPETVKNYVDDCSSFAELICFAELKNKEIITLYRDADLSLPKSEINADDDASKPKENVEIVESIKIVNEYKFNSSIHIANKYSVSALNTQDDSDDDSQYTASFDPQTAEVGIAYHRYLEICDFSLTTCADISQAIKEFEKTNKLIRPDLLDAKVLESALSNPIFKEAIDGNTYRENPFILFVPACDILGGECKDRILVQGTFDLFIMGKRNVLIDYKVTSQTDEIIRHRYATQMRIYALAIKKIYNLKLDAILILAIGKNKSRLIKFDLDAISSIPQKELVPIPN